MADVEVAGHGLMAVVELMEESGLEYSAVMQAQLLANDLKQLSSEA